MNESLQGLKSKPSADLIHATTNKNRDEILEDALEEACQRTSSSMSQEFKDDMFREWSQNNVTSADALGHYPHLKSPKQAIEEIRASFGDR